MVMNFSVRKLSENPKLIFKVWNDLAVQIVNRGSRLWIQYSLQGRGTHCTI